MTVKVKRSPKDTALAVKSAISYITKTFSDDLKCRSYLENIKKLKSELPIINRRNVENDDESGKRQKEQDIRDKNAEITSLKLNEITRRENLFLDTLADAVSEFDISEAHLRVVGDWPKGSFLVDND